MSGFGENPNEIVRFCSENLGLSSKGASFVTLGITTQHGSPIERPPVGVGVTEQPQTGGRWADAALRAGNT